MIQIYDTTLRDGTQREGISLSCADKLRIACKLDVLGVAFIEGGWPGSNPKDAEFFERARDMEWKTALIAAFGSTCRVQGGPEDDANIAALIDARTPVCWWGRRGRFTSSVLRRRSTTTSIIDQPDISARRAAG
jgi:2-isopropylmalate synthase